MLIINILTCTGGNSSQAVENKRPTWCHLLFYFTSYMLNMFQTLIYPSSEAYDYSAELPHWSCVLGSMCVVVLVWLGWSGIHVAGWSLLHGYHSKPTTQKQQHTSNQEHMTSLVIEQNSHKLLMMAILMSKTCWAYKKWNKIISHIKLVFCFQLLQWCTVQ